MVFSSCDFGPWLEGCWAHGRTVAIIGGAEQWDQLEAHQADVVIRINNHWQRQRGRMDVLYTALVEDPTREMLEHIHATAIDPDSRNRQVWFFGDENGSRHSERLKREMIALGAVYTAFTTVRSRLTPAAPQYEPQMCFLQVVMNRYEVKPFTGIVAMLHALHFDVRSVFMTGFTFYAENGSIPKMRHAHDNEKNRQIVIDTLKHDVRLRVDKAMAHALTLPVIP